MGLKDSMQRSPCLTRVAFNLWPCIRGTGGRVTYIAPGWSELSVKPPLSWRTRNCVGTIFGGSLYSAVDPFLMLMLIERLGRDYVVWDEAASIRFREPGTSTLHATFGIGIDDADADGVVHASVEKVLYIATKDTHRVRRARTTEAAT